GGGDIVVFYEDHADDIAGGLVVVDELSDGINQLDNCLRIHISRRSFGTEDESTWWHFFAVLGDAEVEIQNVQSIHQLALVLMQTLDLHIEDGIGVYFCALVLAYPGGKLDLVGAFDLHQ